MIAFLEGQVKMRADRYVILQIGGIGLKIFVSGRALKNFPQEKEHTQLWCHLHVRENALELYGFEHAAEVEFFEHLIALSGIGPKSALGVLNVAPLDTLKKAISAGETGYLTKVSGIGKKTAEKIVLELRDAMGKEFISSGSKKILQEESDTLDALVSMGYSLTQVREALQKVPDTIESVNERIKFALKILS